MKQRGVALLSVVLIVAIVAAVVVQLTNRQLLTIVSTRQTVNQAQAIQYALGAEKFALKLIDNRHRNSDEPRDALVDDWIEPFSPFEYAEGSTVVQIVDLNRRINLNGLQGEFGNAVVKALEKFCEEHEINKNLIPLIRDWIDKDKIPAVNGGEDSYWLLQDESRRTPNTLASHISELNFMRGSDRDLMSKVRGHIDVLPTSEMTLNINTITAPVLHAFSDANISRAHAEAFVASAREYTSSSDAVKALDGFDAITQFLSVVSEYFEIQTSVTYENTRLYMASRVHEDADSGILRVYSREYGNRTF